MTAGLKWWHAVCKEVRKSGVHFGENDYGLEINGRPAEEPELVDEHVQAAVAKCDGLYSGSGTPSNSMRDTEVKFLRIQWMAAYRKARS